MTESDSLDVDVDVYLYVYVNVYVSYQIISDHIISYHRLSRESLFIKALRLLGWHIAIRDLG